MTRKQKKQTNTSDSSFIEPCKKKATPNLRIVAADELSTTKANTGRQRSQLVQSFMDFSDQLDAEIAKLWEL